MREIGRIVNLQIQAGSLKRGESPYRVYDPVNLLVTPALRLTSEGVIGLLPDGSEQLDVHHARHESSRHRDTNSISFNFTSHYERMRRRFGRHIQAGCAGENILVKTEEYLTTDQLASGLLIITAGQQRVYLGQVEFAAPCVPFSEYALDLDMKPPAELTKEALQFLSYGMRGFYAALVGEPAVVRPGDSVWLETANE